MRTIGVGVTFAAAAAVLLFVWSQGHRDVVPVAVAPRGSDIGAAPAMPAMLVLPTGDRVAVGPDARVAVLDGSSASRRVAIDAGSAVFDVAPLDEAESFTVRTPHLLAEVVGTVFRVDVGAGGSRVAVLEGRVRIIEGDREATIEAGAALATAGWVEAHPQVDVRAFVEAALARRAAATTEPGTTAPETHPGRSASEGASAEQPAAPSLDEAHRLLAERRYGEVLAMAARADDDDVDWLLLSADAARASGRHGDAASSFERAIELASPTRAARIGLSAAQLRAQLGEPARALELVRRSRASAAHSPVEERALVLEARLLVELGRELEASALARRYLGRFPAGADSGFMERLAR